MTTAPAATSPSLISSSVIRGTLTGAPGVHWVFVFHVSVLECCYHNHGRPGRFALQMCIRPVSSCLVILCRMHYNITIGVVSVRLFNFFWVDSDYGEED
jgi:hypothetical protein